MNTEEEIIHVTADNVEKSGFFCLKSKPKAAGYRRKLAWLQQRFAEGMGIKILRSGSRMLGFIEYIPGEYAWRAVDAPGYLVIHCLWVVGQAKGQGYGRRLLDECLEDARRQGNHGVAMATSSGAWLAGKEALLKHGFVAVDAAPPSFELLAYRLNGEPFPAFPVDWTARLERCGPGLTVLTSDQCPYLEAAEDGLADIARQRGIELNRVYLQTAAEVQAKAVSPYGIYSVVCNRRVLTYHWEPQQQLDRWVGEAINQN